MSYILEALKKSDQQRRRGATPTLLTPQAASLPPAARRMSMPHVLLLAAMISAGIVIGALRPWQSEPPASIQAPATIVQAARPQVAMTPPENLPSSPAPVQAQMPLHSEQDIPTQKPAPAALPAPATPSPNSIAVTAPPVAARKPEVAATATTTHEQTIMTMAELPLSIQQEIPKMTITVHAYSRSSQERLLGINDRMLREGDYLTPGLLLEQITPDGMIMSYKGYRFRHGVR